MSLIRQREIDNAFRKVNFYRSCGSIPDAKRWGKILLDLIQYPPEISQPELGIDLGNLSQNIRPVNSQTGFRI